MSLVGHSLGGIYAREIARAAPELVRSVITVGSPFAGDLKSNYVWPMYESITGTRIAGLPPEFMETMNEPPPVPSTAIYSRSDGVASGSPASTTAARRPRTSGCRAATWACSTIPWCCT